MTGNNSWSLGTLIGIPVWVIIGLVVLAAIGFFVYEKDVAYAFGGIAVFVVLTVVALAGFYPWHTEYHQWQETKGVVTDVSSRVLTTGSGDDKSINQRFVVNLKGVGQRSCDDTRCANIKTGDTLTITCKRKWQFAGTDGYDCNFVDLRRS
jgi:hypothetical protein